MRLAIVIPMGDGGFVLFFGFIRRARSVSVAVFITRARSLSHMIITVMALTLRTTDDTCRQRVLATNEGQYHADDVDVDDVVRVGCIVCCVVLCLLLIR